MFAPLGVKVGGERLVETAERFGFNQPPGIPGAATSTIPAAEEIGGPLAVGASAIGQGKVLATPLEMASIAQTIAAGGERTPPTIVAAAAPPKPVRVTTGKVARQVEKMMIAVVKYGTGTAAAIDGVRVAGKTGTAEYYDAEAGRYSGRTASFIGYAPADDPQIVVAVIVQKPTYPFFGGYVAGPVFKDVTTYALQELKIPPTGAKPPKVTLRVSPEKALADPTLLRDGRKRAGG